MDAPAFARLLDDLGAAVRYLTVAEYCGYLHAQVDRNLTVENGLALRVGYDGQYCGYFEKHPSTWVLHLSDDTRAKLKPALPERRIITLPPGLGSHPVKP